MTTMKIKHFLAVTLTALSLGVSSYTLADRGRDDYRGYDNRNYGRNYDNRSYDNRHDYYRGNDYRHSGRYEKHHGHHSPVIVKNYYGHPRHYAPVRYYRAPPPRYYRGDHYVVRHHDHDEVFLWLGGVYLLNEIIHHNRH
jgi:hypothetical protein